jgi:hypothetical protein
LLNLSWDISLFCSLKLYLDFQFSINGVILCSQSILRSSGKKWSPNTLVFTCEHQMALLLNLSNFLSTVQAVEIIYRVKVSGLGLVFPSLGPRPEGGMILSSETPAEGTAMPAL